MIDTAALLARVDLLAIVESDLGPPAKHRSGSPRAYFFCPFHDDGQHPHLEVNTRKGKVFCNSGCGFGLDAIGWTMKFHRLAFREACQRLGAEEDTRRITPSAAQRPEPAGIEPPSEPPSPAWQKQAWDVAAEAADTLHSPAGAKALAWLMNARGLLLGTIERWALGYLPADRYPNPVNWGLARTDRVWLPRGIVIPCIVGDVLWGLHVRRPVGEPKYVNTTGSRKALWGAETLPGRRAVVLAEGEFDGMVVWQQARDLVGVGSPTTGASSHWQSDWTPRIFDAEAILVCYDTDNAGANGARAKMAALGQRLALCPPPSGKDISDFYLAGGDVHAWLAAERRKALDCDPLNLERRLRGLDGSPLAADIRADLEEARRER